jgi:hypothetical protein
MIRTFTISATLAALTFGTAAADAFRVGDLGPMPSRRACMETAAKVLEAYVAEHGGLSVSSDAEDPEGWATYAWGLRPGVIDAVITCPVVVNQVNAFYTLHSSGERAAEFADAAATRIRALWEELY